MKKILITGSSGFIGNNLVVTLEAQDYEILKFDREDTIDTLEKYLQESDVVVHLAGINRPENVEEFYKGNAGLTQTLVDLLVKHVRKIPIIVSSSIQAENESDYGQSKKQAEDILVKYQNDMAPVYIFRLSNVYGKWSRPNYNSVIATWCHNITHDLDLVVNDPGIEIPFVYIDDVVKNIVKAINGEIEINDRATYEVHPIDVVSLGEVKGLLESFRESRKDLSFPNQDTRFAKNLYSTYLSYIPLNKMSYDLKMNVDPRGSFTEFMKDDVLGQVSVNVSKPGITKGQHWHHSKNEKFLVVYGTGSIEIRHIITNEKYTYNVSGEKLQVVDIPTGYTHNIINTGTTDMVTLMWANEKFDPNNPDTFFLEV